MISPCLGPSLRYLDIEPLGWNTTHLQQCADLLPGLEHLSIVCHEGITPEEVLEKFSHVRMYISGQEMVIIWNMMISSTYPYPPDIDNNNNHNHRYHQSI